MFLFASLQWHTVLMFFGVLAALLLINEISRLSKWVVLAIFLALPIFLTIFVWPNSADADSSVGTWFHYAKIYSVLAVVLLITGIKSFESWRKNKIILTLPAVLLAVNILEAVMRDFECSQLAAGFHDGVFIVGGPWNIMNGIAGILNILAISGWLGITISKKKKKDFLWPDQIWVWIIPYDLWNFAYVYNCISNHAYYAGAALLLACTIPALFIKKGAWLQHRAFTLAAWVMFAMTFPAFMDNSMFAVKSTAEATGNTTGLFVVSLLALISNIALIIYHVYRIVRYKRNPFTGEVYKGLKAYDHAANET